MNSLLEAKFPKTGTKTQKLISLIEIAMNAPSLLPGISLKYRISGDVIELHIENTGIFNEDYRLALISCGLVLSYIQRAIEENNYIPFIQSFPSVEEPRLVAFIRIEKPQNQVNSKRMNQYNVSDGLPLLRQILTESNARILEIDENNETRLIEHCREMKIETTLQYIKSQHLWNLTLQCDNERSHKPTDKSQVWLISTSMNNSISWLGIGKILGNFLRLCKEGRFQYNVDINLLENGDFRNHLNSEYSVSGYTQFMIKVTNYN
ncbi:MAG: hypothetical protein WD267_10825 [Balneolales bacterium]